MRTMAGCYAPEASFEDWVSRCMVATRSQGCGECLCIATDAGGRDVWQLQYPDVQTEAASGHAHWDAHCRLSSTGRMVDNSIERI